MEPEELASGLHVHLVRSGGVVDENGLYKIHDDLEGAGALRTYLAQCQMSLNELLRSFPDYFVEAGRGKWKAASTNAFNTILQSGNDPKKGNSKGRGGRGAPRGRGQPVRRGVGGGGGFSTRGRGFGGSGYSMRGNSSRPSPAPSFNNSFQPNRSSNNFDDLYDRGRAPSGFRAPSPPPRPPPRNDFQYNNQRDDRNYGRPPPFDNRRNNQDDGYYRHLDNPNVDVSRSYFEESAYDERRRTPPRKLSPRRSPPPRSVSPPTRYGRDYDDSQYDRRGPTPTAPFRRPDNDPYPSKGARDTRDPYDGPGWYKDAPRYPPPRQDPYEAPRRYEDAPRNPPPRNDPYEAPRNPPPRQDPYGAPRRYEDAPRNPPPQNAPYEAPQRYQQPRRAVEDDEYSQHSDSSSRPTTSSRAPAPSGDMSDLARIFNENTHISTSTPQPTGRMQEPPGLEKPVEENDVTHRQAKKCRRAFKHLGLPASVHMRDFIAAVETELRELLPGSTDAEKEAYLVKLQKTYPHVMSKFEIDRKTSIVKRCVDPADVVIEPKEPIRSHVESAPTSSSSQRSAREPTVYLGNLAHQMCNSLPDRRERQVEVTHFLKFSNFAVRLVEELEDYERMDKEIQATMEDSRNPMLAGTIEKWTRYDACLWKDSDPSKPEKWRRAVVLQVEIRMIRIYLIDVGMVKMAKTPEMAPMPSQFLKTPPFALQCTLDATDEEMEDLELDSAKWRRKFVENQFERIFIYPTEGESRPTRDGVKTLRVEMLVTVLGRKKNVLDCV